MSLPNAAPIRMDWADENVSSEGVHTDDAYADALLIEVLHSEILEAHEARCDRIARRVMMRVAELPTPSSLSS